MTVTHVYAADIEKSYRNDDGDLVVEGIATSPDLDLDQQVCDPSWLKTAMPDWFKWGNVREQHGNNAAGTGTELEHQDDDKWKLTSLVTDPVAQHKVETKTYRGYSIGIRDPRVIRDKAAPGGRIVGGSIVEISLVDRPCNPVATLALAKAASPAVQKAAVVDTARMLVKVEEPHEYPENEAKTGDPVEARIEATQSTKSAVTYPASVEKIADLVKGLKPRTKDRAATVAHIVAEAQRLKRADLLPADLVKTAQHDPSMIGAIRDGLVACINAELQELCDGEPELCDIEQLFSSLWTLMSWWEDEAWQGETASPYSGDLGDEVALWLAAQPEKEKAVADTDTTKTEDTTKATEPDTGKAAPETSGAVAVPEKLTELVKAAVAEAQQASDERVKALEAELAKVMAMPVPGGPVIARAGDSTKAAEHNEKLAHFSHLAKTVTDRDLRAFYREEVRKLTSQNGSDS